LNVLSFFKSSSAGASLGFSVVRPPRTCSVQFLKTWL
jgi:hypothetical protein